MRFSTSVIMLLYVPFCVLAAIVFFEYALPSLDGQIRARLFADTLTYENIAKKYTFVESANTIVFSLYGPVFLFNILQQDRLIVFIFNIVVVGIAIYSIIKNFDMNRGRLFLLLLTMPMLFFSLFGINKEIALFCSSVFFMTYLKTWRLKFLIIALLAAAIARWQMAIFIILMIPLLKLEILNKSRVFTAVMLLFAVSFIVGFQSDAYLSHMNAVLELGAVEEIGTSASGIFGRMVEIQNNFGYFLVFIPKFFHLYFGILFRFDLSMISEDFWNNFVVMFQSLHSLFILIYLFFASRIKFSQTLFYGSLIYAILFAVSPIYGPRYLFPINIWLVMLACLEPRNFRRDNSDAQSGSDRPMGGRQFGTFGQRPDSDDRSAGWVR